MSAEQGLTLLDAALGRPEAQLVPARLDVGALRAAARSGSGELPALLRGLAGAGGPARGRGGVAAPGRVEVAAAAAGRAGGG